MVDSSQTNMTERAALNLNPAYSGPKAAPWTTETFLEFASKHSIVFCARGTKAMPRCGFTARVMDFLDEAGVTYACLDVYADKSVIPVVTALYGRCSFPVLIAENKAICEFDQIQAYVAQQQLLANG